MIDKRSSQTVEMKMWSNEEQEEIRSILRPFLKVKLDQSRIYVLKLYIKAYIIIG